MTNTNSYSRNHFALVVIVLLFPSLAIAADGDEPQLLTSYDDLLDRLQKDSVLYQADTESKSVRIPTKIDGQQTVLFIRWRKNDRVVQFTQILPIEIPEDRLPAMDTAITRVNFALSVPGVELDHKQRVAAYRLTIPFWLREGISAKELHLYLHTVHKQAQKLSSPLKKIAQDGADPIDVLKLLANEGYRGSKQ